jgi:Mg/Co/Ni transporter MgtE
MTTVMVTVNGADSVADVRERLRADAEHRDEIDAVLVVDDDGRLVDDVSLFELFVADPDVRVAALVAPPWPVVVDADATLEQVVARLIENRRSSIVVVDDDGRPAGRILADDIVDALVADRGRTHFPRLLA